MLHGLTGAYFDGAFCGCCAGLGETGSLSCAQGEGLGHLQGQARDSDGWWSGHRSVGAESCWVLQGPGLLTGLHVWPGSLWQGRLGAYHAHRGRGWRGCRSGLRTLGLVGGGTGVLGESLVGACRGLGLSQDCRSGLGRCVWDVLAVWDGVERHRGAVWARPGTGVSAGGAPRRVAGRGGENGRKMVRDPVPQSTPANNPH